MSVVKDLMYFLMKKLLPMDILKNPQRLLRMSLFINELRSLFDQSLDEAVKNCNLSISECSELMKTYHGTSKDFDLEIINYMIEISETFENVLRVFSVGLHYRQQKNYGKIIADKLSEKDLPHDVWYRLLTHKDPWFLRISDAIERVLLIKTFETAPSSEVIIFVTNDYYKRSSFSIKTMLSALSDAKISIDFWREIEKISTKKEVKAIAKEKINQISVEGKNQICQT